MYAPARLFVSHLIDSLMILNGFRQLLWQVVYQLCPLLQLHGFLPDPIILTRAHLLPQFIGVDLLRALLD